MDKIDATNYDEKTLFPSVLAVDFDGTLVENAFPNIGKFNEDILSLVKEYQKQGWKIILYTCRTDMMLEEAVWACKQRGLIFDAVNDNLPEVVSYFGGNTRKIFANLYLDDRSALIVRSNPPARSCSLIQAPLFIMDGQLIKDSHGS